MNESQFDCLIQGLEIAADSCLHICRSTLLEYFKCATPGFVTFADKVQFYAVYLIDQHFSVVVLLSPPLTFTMVSERKRIAIIAVANYVKESIIMLEGSKSKESLDVLSFNYCALFFKPIKALIKLQQYKI